MSRITDYDIYNERMGKGMKDKLFFLDMLTPNIDTIVDFGCADGTLLAELNKRKVPCPDSDGTMPFEQRCTYIGIDNDDTMLARAKDRFKTRKAFFYSSLEKAIADNRFKPSNAAVVFSSVVHEIVHYGSMEELTNILTEVANNGFGQVIIRDMAIRSKHYHIGADVPLTISTNPMWQNFISYRGLDEHSVITEDILTEFLLKYKYIENWVRERDEHYFPAPIETLKTMYDDIFHNYELSYSSHRLHKYTKANVKYDWHIDLKVPTHYKRVYTLIQ